MLTRATVLSKSKPNLETVSVNHKKKEALLPVLPGARLGI